MIYRRRLITFFKKIFKLIFKNFRLKTPTPVIIFGEKYLHPAAISLFYRLWGGFGDLGPEINKSLQLNGIAIFLGVINP